MFQQKSVLYVYSCNSEVEIYLDKGIFRKKSSLSEMEGVLDNRLFYRVSKQYIVNMSRINSYQKGIITIRGTEIKVSVRRKKEFEKAYMCFKILFDMA